jgi:hypothetical protein
MVENRAVMAWLHGLFNAFSGSRFKAQDLVPRSARILDQLWTLDIMRQLGCAPAKSGSSRRSLGLQFCAKSLHHFHICDPKDLSLGYHQ